MFQGYSIEELHYDERATILLVNLMDRANVGMVEGRRRFRLALKAG
jgi:hypothetical protein